MWTIEKAPDSGPLGTFWGAEIRDLTGMNDDVAAVSTELHDLPVVFAGYGLSVPRLSYDDYATSFETFLLLTAGVVLGVDPPDEQQQQREHDVELGLDGDRPERLIGGPRTDEVLHQQAVDDDG